MVVEPISNDKIRIKLSNTESVGQNIFKYTSLLKEKETKSKSSTCNYFLTTNKSLAMELKKILNDTNVRYFLDVENIKKCIFNEIELINKYDLTNDFKGNLSPLYTAKDYFFYTNEKFIDIGYGIVRLDQGGKYNIYFNNQDEKVEMFRSCVVAILSDIIIEKQNDKFIVYPVIKEGLPFEQTNLSTEKIIELAKQLEYKYDEEIIKELILEGYKLLNK